MFALPAMRPAMIGSSLLPQTLALIAAMTTPPTAARKVLLNNLIAALINGGAWAVMDHLYVLAAADSQAAKLDWKNPSSTALTENGGLTFTADSGYDGNGTDAYLSTGYSRATSGNLSQNSAHAGTFPTENVTSGAVPDVGTIAGSSRFFVIARTTGDTASTRVNDATVFTGGTVTDARKHVVVNRNGANLRQLYVSGAEVNNDTAASGATTTDEIGALKNNTAAYSTRRSGLFHFGQSISAAQVAAANTAFTTYLQALGAIP